MIPLDLPPDLLADLDAYALDRGIGRADAVAELLAAALAPVPSGIHVPSRWDTVALAALEYRAAATELLRQVRLTAPQDAAERPEALPALVLRQVAVHAARGAHDGRGVAEWARRAG